MSTKFIDIRSDIFILEQGQTSKPIHSITRIFIFHIHRKYTIKRKSGTEEKRKAMIERRLRRYEDKRLANAFDKRTYKAAKIDINDEIADKFWKLIQTDGI